MARRKKKTALDLAVGLMFAPITVPVKGAIAVAGAVEKANREKERREAQEARIRAQAARQREQEARRRERERKQQALQEAREYKAAEREFIRLVKEDERKEIILDLERRIDEALK